MGQSAAGCDEWTSCRRKETAGMHNAHWASSQIGSIFTSKMPHGSNSATSSLTTTVTLNTVSSSYQVYPRAFWKKL
eukprot:2554223-Pleurochrysis_carterae.AAC.1